MEPENVNTVKKEIEVEINEQKSNSHKVTPLSKYLAMVLFILMPFVGGWIGYNYSPEKIVEVEKIVQVESGDTYKEKYFSSYYINSNVENIELDKFENLDLGISFNYPKIWGKVVVSGVDVENCNPEYLEGVCPSGIVSFSGYARPWTEDMLDVNFMSVTSEGKRGQRRSNELWWLDFVDEYDFDYVEKCEESPDCQVIENSNNVILTKTFKPIDCYMGCDDEDSSMGYEYGVYNKNAPFQSVLMSAFYLKEEFLSARPVESAFEKYVVRSFEWLPVD